MQRNINARIGQPARGGFTLVELLVVITIIAVLLALGASAAYRLMASQMTSNTRLAIQRLDSRLKQQMAFARDKIALDNPPPAFAQALASYGTPATPNMELAKVIHMKLRFKQWFPQTFAEALTPVAPGYQPTRGYVSYLGTYGITRSSTLPGFESAACLYMILQHGPETTGESDLGVTTSTLNTPGIPVVVDAWGQPLTFCRWPTGDLTSGGGNTGISPVNPNGAQVGTFDPLDPKGLLSNQAWLSSANRRIFESVCHPVLNRSNTGKTQSLDLTSVIVSNGADKQLGLNPLSLQYTTPSQAYDNVYLANR
jgi:prepilin-type N-terminal cleavage/methylation domain-containing protein